MTRIALPRNEYLLTHQAAATPKTTLSGTEISTANTVSLRADSASGSRMAAKNPPRPLLKPWPITTTNGSNRKNAKTSQPRPIRMRRDTALPRRAALAEDAAMSDESDIGAPPQLGVSMRRCNRLISSNSTNDTSSIITPIAVAPV